MPRHSTARAVRDPRPARTRPPGAGPRAATAAGAKLDAGLARSPPSFGCHQRGSREVLGSGESLRPNTVHVNSLWPRTRSPQPPLPPTEHRPYQTAPGGLSIRLRPARSRRRATIRSGQIAGSTPVATLKGAMFVRQGCRRRERSASRNDKGRCAGNAGCPPGPPIDWGDVLIGGARHSRGPASPRAVASRSQASSAKPGAREPPPRPSLPPSPLRPNGTSPLSNPARGSAIWLRPGASARLRPGARRCRAAESRSNAEVEKGDVSLWGRWRRGRRLPLDWRDVPLRSMPSPKPPRTDRPAGPARPD